MQEYSFSTYETVESGSPVKTTPFKENFTCFFQDPLTEQHLYSNDCHNQCYLKTRERDEVPSFEKARALSEENKGELTDERFLYPDASTTCFPRPQ